MRVLTILNSLDIGGIEKTLLSCMPYLKEQGVKVDICCFQRNGKLEEYFIEYGAEIFYLKKSGSIFFDSFQLLKILNKNEYSVVHSRLSYTSGGFGIACQLKSVPFYISIHNEFASTLISWDKKKILKDVRKVYLKLHKEITLLTSKLIIGHSNSNLDRNFKNWKNNQKFKVIHNGVDFKKLNTKHVFKYEKRDFVIIHIGSFRYQKNHLFLIDSFFKLNPKENNYKLYLIGGGERKDEILKRIQLYDLTDHIILVGIVENIGKYLKEAHMFYFPSLFEGLANVLMEAQYLGLSICASRIKPHYESVYHIYHDYFFNPEDIEESVASLKKMILRTKKDDFKETKVKAKDFVVQNFSIEKMAKKLIEIYKDS